MSCSRILFYDEEENWLKLSSIYLKKTSDQLETYIDVFVIY